jgi:hypothetical protein
MAENLQKELLMMYMEIKKIKEKMKINQIIITEGIYCPKIRPSIKKINKKIKKL